MSRECIWFLIFLGLPFQNRVEITIHALCEQVRKTVSPGPSVPGHVFYINNDIWESDVRVLL